MLILVDPCHPIPATGCTVGVYLEMGESFARNLFGIGCGRCFVGECRGFGILGPPPGPLHPVTTRGEPTTTLLL